MTTFARHLASSRSGLRAAPSHSNIKAATTAAAGGGHTTAPVSSRSVACSSSTSLLPDPSGSLPEVASAAEKENKAGNPTASALQQPENPQSPSGSSSGNAFTATATATTTASGSNSKSNQSPATPTAGAGDDANKKPQKTTAAGKKKLGSLRRGVSGLPASSNMGVSSRKLGASAMGVSTARLGTGHSRGGVKHHGGGGGGGRGKAPAGTVETPERHAARNLEIFEQNLEGLSLPKGVAGKGAGGDRYGCALQFARVVTVRGVRKYVLPCG